jgi:hypothetical protein
MEKGTDTLVPAVKDHFARERDMLEEMISNIPDAEWTKGTTGQTISVQHVVPVVV